MTILWGLWLFLSKHFTEEPKESNSWLSRICRGGIPDLVPSPQTPIELNFS
jgi:hypothetical protein